MQDSFKCLATASLQAYIWYVMKERKLMVVFWEDITSSDDSWQGEDEAITWAEHADSIVRQVGFLLSEDEDYIILTGSYIPGLDQVGTTTRIPRAVIKYVAEMTIDAFKVNTQK